MSADERTEKWLWRVAEHIDAEGVPSVSDEELRAYRSGELDEAGGERVEWAIGQDPKVRARMIALAGGVPDRSESVRDQLLGASRRPRWRPMWGLVAAAVLVLGIALPLALRWNESSHPPIDLATTRFDIQIEGSIDVRTVPDTADPDTGDPDTGDPDTDNVVKALPGTRLTLRIEPDGVLNDRVDYALYRQDGDGLSRVRAGDDVVFDVTRGAAHIEAAVDAIVPATAGPHTFWIVVAERGSFPSEIRGPVAEPAERLRRETRGAVFARTIHIQGETP